MSYTTADARKQMLEDIARAVDELGQALATLGEVYDQLDDHMADRLEEELFRPVQVAYGRAQRTYGEFVERHGLQGRAFTAQQPHVRPHDARGGIEFAVDAVARADDGLAALQDSMMPIEVGDTQLRDGLSEVRRLVGEIRSRARELLRMLGR